MVEYIHVYCKVDCSYCAQAISLLEEQKKDFVITIIDHCKPFEEGIKRSLNFNTVPIVLKCSPTGKIEMVGGYTELKEYLESDKRRLNG